MKKKLFHFSQTNNLKHNRKANVLPFLPIMYQGNRCMSLVSQGSCNDYETCFNKSYP